MINGCASSWNPPFHMCLGFIVPLPVQWIGFKAMLLFVYRIHRDLATTLPLIPSKLKPSHLHGQYHVHISYTLKKEEKNVAVIL